MDTEHDAEVWRLTITLLQALPDWDQATLAARSGLNPSQISEYRSGKTVPRRKNRERIAAAVGASPALLEQMESFLSNVLTAWKNGQNRGAAFETSGDWGSSAAGIVEREATRTLEELALLRSRP
jgi:transcriptional regulator with XRE-family HTH domain